MEKMELENLLQNLGATEVDELLAYYISDLTPEAMDELVIQNEDFIDHIYKKYEGTMIPTVQRAFIREFFNNAIQDDFDKDTGI